MEGLQIKNGKDESHSNRGTKGKDLTDLQWYVPLFGQRMKTARLTIKKLIYFFRNFPKIIIYIIKNLNYLF